MTGVAATLQRRQELIAVDAVLAAGVVDGMKAAIGQPTQPIRKSRNTRMVAGEVLITSPTASKGVGMLGFLMR